MSLSSIKHESPPDAQPRNSQPSKVPGAPLDFLPPRLQAYASFPYGILALWVLVIFGISLLPPPNLEPRGAASPAPAGLVRVEIEGRPFELVQGNAPSGSDIKGLRLSLYSGQELFIARITSPENVQWLLQDTQGTLLAQHVLEHGKEDSRLYLNDGSVLFQVETRDEGFGIKDSTGNRIYKIKLKVEEDQEMKFNLYDHSDTRVRRGKEKNSAIQIRNDGTDVLGTVSFSGSYPLESRLELSAFFALPLPESQAALIAARFFPDDWWP